MVQAVARDTRFDVPLYSVADAARHIDVPRATFDTWVSRYERHRDRRPTTVGEPIVTAVDAPRGEPRVPFIGLAEGFVLASFRAAGVPLQRIRPAIDALADEFGIQHVLASQALYTDGAEVLYDFAQHRQDTPEGEATRELVVPRSGQRVFAPVVRDYLRRITYADRYAAQLRLPQYRRAEVIVDPSRGFGAPIFAHGSARVHVVLGRFKAGESVEELSGEFAVPVEDLIDAIRVHTVAAAA